VNGFLSNGDPPEAAALPKPSSIAWRTPRSTGAFVREPANKLPVFTMDNHLSDLARVFSLVHPAGLR